MVSAKIGDILTILMGDMSESALARAVNLPKATIHRVLSGSTPDPRAGTLLPIAQYFNITIEQLMGVATLPSDSPLESTENFSAVEIPFISFCDLKNWVSGNYKSSISYKITSFSNKPIDFNCFITQINSNEMAPLFSDKTYLIASKELILQQDDVIIIFNKIDHNVLLRKYVELKGGKYLISSNPSYNIIDFDENIELIGVVIEGRIII